MALFLEDQQIEIYRTLCGSDNNNAYLIVCSETRESVLIDAPLNPGAILEHAIGTVVKAILITHRHKDHTEGLAEAITKTQAPVLAHPADIEEIPASCIPVEDGQRIAFGKNEVVAIHTPGHTPGSQCFLVDGRLVAGDTLFLEGCGRTDLPGGDPAALYHSLHHRLAKVPDDAVLYPGHLYSPQPSAPMGDTRRDNFVFMPRSEEQWLAMFGG